MTPRERFIRDCRCHARLVGHADTIAGAFKAMESESYDVEDAATCLRAIECIMLQDDLTIDQKLHHINRLMSLDKVENFDVKEFIRLQ